MTRDDFRHLIGQRTTMPSVEHGRGDITGIIASVDEIGDDHLIVRFESGYQVRFSRTLAEAVRPRS